VETVSSKSHTLQDVASVDDFLNVAATETVPLFEHLEFEFLTEYDVYASSPLGRTRVHKPPALLLRLLYCYYKNVYGTQPISRRFQNQLVWRCCGFDRPLLRDAIDRFLTEFEHVVDEVFDNLVQQAALRGLLDSTYLINLTHVEAIQWNDEAS
jgi:transposase